MTIGAKGLGESKGYREPGPGEKLWFTSMVLLFFSLKLSRAGRCDLCLYSLYSSASCILKESSACSTESTCLKRLKLGFLSGLSILKVEKRFLAPLEKLVF